MLLVRTEINIEQTTTTTTSKSTIIFDSAKQNENHQKMKKKRKFWKVQPLQNRFYCRVPPLKLVILFWEVVGFIKKFSVIKMFVFYVHDTVLFTGQNLALLQKMNLRLLLWLIYLLFGKQFKVRHARVCEHGLMSVEFYPDSVFTLFWISKIKDQFRSPIRTLSVQHSIQCKMDVTEGSDFVWGFLLKGNFR